MPYWMKQMRRVINGDIPAKPVPWQVNLMYNFRPGCGGVLIDQTTIITAAHCIKTFGNTDEFDLRPTSYRVIFGSKYRKKQKNDLELTPSEIVPHPAYKKGYFHDDIAIVKIPWKHRISYDYDIQPLCLPHKNYMRIQDNLYVPPFDSMWQNDECYISGFGSTRKSTYTIKL